MPILINIGGLAGCGYNQYVRKETRIMIGRQFYAIMLVILILCDVILWVRSARVPPTKRAGQLIGAIGCLLATISVAVIFLMTGS